MTIVQFMRDWPICGIILFGFLLRTGWMWHVVMTTAADMFYDVFRNAVRRWRGQRVIRRWRLEYRQQLEREAGNVGIKSGKGESNESLRMRIRRVHLP